MLASEPSAPTYEEILIQQEQKAISERGPGDIAKLLHVGRDLEDRLAPRGRSVPPSAACSTCRARLAAAFGRRLASHFDSLHDGPVDLTPEPPSASSRASSGPRASSSSPEGRLTYECDMHTFYKGAPDVVVLPETRGAGARRSCGSAGASTVPIVPRGSGTGLIGGAMAPAGGVMVVDDPDEPASSSSTSPTAAPPSSRASSTCG